MIINKVLTIIWMILPLSIIGKLIIGLPVYIMNMALIKLEDSQISQGESDMNSATKPIASSVTY